MTAAKPKADGTTTKAKTVAEVTPEDQTPTLGFVGGTEARLARDPNAYTVAGVIAGLPTDDRPGLPENAPASAPEPDVED